MWPVGPGLRGKRAVDLNLAFAVCAIHVSAAFPGPGWLRRSFCYWRNSTLSRVARRDRDLRKGEKNAKPADCSTGSGAKWLQNLLLVGIPADEAVAVGHAHLRQRVLVHRFVLADDLVERENVGGQRIGLVGSQRFWRRPRHRATREVEDGRGMGHIKRHRTLAASRRTGQVGVLAAVAVLAVADLAFLRVDRGTLGRGAAAGGKPRAVGADADVPERNIGFVDLLPEPGPVGRERHARGKRERNGKRQTLTHRHSWPPLCRRS